MAETIALPLLVEVAKPLVKLVSSRVTEEIRFIVGFRREFEDLQEKIQIIAGMVDSMTAVPNAAVKLWLRKTIRILHNAEDMMDVLAYEKQRRVILKTRPKKTGSFAGKISRLVFLPVERLSFRCKMGRWIRKINTDIQALKNDTRWIKELKDVVNSSASSSSQPAATSSINDQVLQQVRRNVDTSLFVGRDSDLAIVVDMLLSSCSQDSHDNNCDYRLPVVAIVGIGGLGKTTLAKQVCENDRVKIHYSERIWISELKDFNIERILNKMVEFLVLGNYEDVGTETTIRKLEKHLGGKRYLLVLDDVWDINPQCWHSMRSALERIGGSKESMILTTTRSDSVAKTMNASSVHHLPGLTEGNSWSLFQKIAFANGMNGEDFALEPVGRNIVEKCKGVPLAIRSMAGILHNQPNLHVWKNIEESKLWYIHQDETGVLPSLKLSYNHLSTPMLKTCFSLCAFSPKGWWFQKHELICRWMALGLIQNSSIGHMTMEDVGEQYINELLSISFLLVRDTDELGEPSGYILHDLVYDLARSVAMLERLYLETDKKENRADLEIQHLTIVEKEEITLDFPHKLELQKIRSLEVKQNLPQGLLIHVKYLRVLSLYSTAIKAVPESIAGLKCLKYLDLEDNPIEVLPECLMELYNLQSLFLYECEPLSTLPTRLSNLVNLRHLGLSFHLCPTEEGVIRQLSQLQTIPPLQVKEGGFQISELGNLDNVKGSLDITGLEVITSKLEAENSKLSMKPRVEELRLSWDKDTNNINHEEVLDGLHPNPSLKILYIRGYGGEKFPSWLTRMNVPKGCSNGYDAYTPFNMMKIKLIDCGRCLQLPTLGHLSCLKILKIKNMEKLKQIGTEFYSDGESLDGIMKQQTSSSGSNTSVESMVNFKSLKRLELNGLSSLEEWCEPPGLCTGFLSLEVLIIERCENLRNAPNKFPMLKELSFKFMSDGYPLTKIISNKSSLSCLMKLEIFKVPKLVHIPEEVGSCTSLEVMKIKWCPKLVSIPNLSGLCALREVELFENNGLKGAPEGLESCKSLEKVWICCCEKVETLPDLEGLSRLWNLGIRGMRKMISEPPEWLYSLPSLRVLHIGTYKELNEFPDFSCLLRIPSLVHLFVYGWIKLKSLPEQLQQFTTLKTLKFFDFNNVEDIPDWLGNLSSLRYLCFERCKRLKKFPSREAIMERPHDLDINIRHCPLLEEAAKESANEFDVNYV